MQTEIAYLRSGSVRIIQTGACRFEVQALRPLGDGEAVWKRLYDVPGRAKAIGLLESYGYHSTARKCEQGQGAHHA